MNAKRVKSDKDGKIAVDSKSTEFYLVEITPTVKVDEQPAAKYATGTRQDTIITEWIPAPPKPKDEKPV